MRDADGQLTSPGRPPGGRSGLCPGAGAVAGGPSLYSQLASDGVMAIPVDGEMLRVQREGEGNRVTRHGWYRFVPLVEG